MEGDLTWGGRHTIQHTDDVLQNRTPETCIFLLTNVMPISSIKKEVSWKTKVKIFLETMTYSTKSLLRSYFNKPDKY